MKKFLLPFSVFLLAQAPVCAQYINTLHSSNTDYYSVVNAVPAAAGGYYVQYSPMSSSKPSIVRLNAAGDTVWNKQYDIGGSSFSLNSFCETSSGNLIGAGTINQAVSLFGLNSSGVPQWYTTRNISFMSGGSLSGVQVAADGPGAMFVCGASSRDSVFIGRVDSAGSLQFVNTFDVNAITGTAGTGNPFPKAICKTASGDFVVVLDVYAGGPLTYHLVVKFSPSGSVYYAKYFTPGGAVSGISTSGVTEAANGDLLVSGNLTMSGQNGAFLIRLDANANLIWAEQVQNQAYSAYITEHSNGELTLGVGSHALTPDNIPKSAFIHLSSSGNFIWCRNFGSSNNNNMYGISTDANDFAQTITYHFGYTSQGSIGMLNADTNGKMSGCSDIISNAPIVSWTPVMNTMTFGISPVSYSLPNLSTVNTSPGIPFVHSNPQLNITGTVAPPLCYGGFGNVYLNVSNGYNPYVYTWSNGTSNQNLLNVLGGTYYSRVSDAKGCVRIDTFVVTTPAQLAATSVVSNVTCFGAQNGAINITTSGGTPGYTYQWATQDTTEDLSGLSGGFYQVTITDANSCTKTIGIAVAEPQQLITGISSSSNVTCTGFCNGSLSGIASGGTPPYSYSWNNSGGSTTQSISGLCPGNYLFTVTDAKNCVSFSNGIITEPNPLSVSTSAMGTACGNSDGWAAAAVTGGVAPYSYTWTGGAVNDTAISLGSGTYTVTVTDNNGCNATATASVDIQTLTQAICLVTVDTSNHNVVVWEKGSAGNIAGYNIYRNVVGAYTLIGYVPYDSLSEFVDLTFGVDPNITSYRYEISAVDTCGYESMLSSYHQTIHLTSSLGVGGEVNLVWDNYEGFAYSYNRILRDSTWNGSWQLLDSVPATNFTWTDLTPPDSARYLIEVVSGTPCNATRSIINTSRSNIKSQLAASPSIGIAETIVPEAVSFPNPAHEILNIACPFAGAQTKIEVYDAQGRQVRTDQVRTQKFELNVQEWARGIYFFILSDSGLARAKGKFQVD